MTWLQLIDELRKQPMHLLERDVQVWNYIGDDHGDIQTLVGTPDKLLTRDNDDGCFEPGDWDEDGCCTLSLQCYYQVPEEFYTKRKDFDGTVKKPCKYKVKCYESTEYTFEVEAEDEDSAWEVAHDILLGKDGCEGAIRLESPNETPIDFDVTEREWDITEA